MASGGFREIDEDSSVIQRMKTNGSLDAEYAKTMGHLRTSSTSTVTEGMISNEAGVVDTTEPTLLTNQLAPSHHKRTASSITVLVRSFSQRVIKGKGGEDDEKKGKKSKKKSSSLKSKKSKEKEEEQVVIPTIPAPPPPIFTSTPVLKLQNRVVPGTKIILIGPEKSGKTTYVYSLCSLSRDSNGNVQQPEPVLDSHFMLYKLTNGKEKRAQIWDMSALGLSEATPEALNHYIRDADGIIVVLPEINCEDAFKETEPLIKNIKSSFKSIIQTDRSKTAPVFMLLLNQWSGREQICQKYILKSIGKDFGFDIKRYVNVKSGEGVQDSFVDLVQEIYYKQRKTTNNDSITTGAAESSTSPDKKTSTSPSALYSSNDTVLITATPISSSSTTTENASTVSDGSSLKTPLNPNDDINGEEETQQQQQQQSKVGCCKGFLMLFISNPQSNEEIDNQDDNNL